MTLGHLISINLVGMLWWKRPKTDYTLSQDNLIIYSVVFLFYFLITRVFVCCCINGSCWWNWICKESRYKWLFESESWSCKLHRLHAYLLPDSSVWSHWYQWSVHWCRRYVIHSINMWLVGKVLWEVWSHMATTKSKIIVSDLFV